jgi:hypothetical protein
VSGSIYLLMPVLRAFMLAMLGGSRPLRNRTIDTRIFSTAETPVRRE